MTKLPNGQIWQFENLAIWKFRMCHSDHAGASVLSEFHWEPQPRAQALVNELIAQFLARCGEAAAFAERLRRDTATRFLDWIDHIQMPSTPALWKRLVDVGFTLAPAPGAANRYVHLG